MASKSPHRIWPPEEAHPPAVVGANVVPGGSASRQAARWAALQAKDVMRTDLVSLPASMPLSEVERTLSEARVGGAPVVDGAGNVLGVVSMRDLFERYAEDPDARPCRGRDAEAFPLEEVLDADEEAPFASRDLDGEETAADVMTGHVRSVAPTADLAEIAREMVAHRVHRLLVKDGDRYVGLIGTFDVLDALAG